MRAFSIARFAHDGKYRASGEPAFLHCVAVARILAELGAGEGAVSAALLHDVLDKTLLLEAQLRPMLQVGGKSLLGRIALGTLPRQTWEPVRATFVRATFVAGGAWAAAGLPCPCLPMPCLRVSRPPSSTSPPRAGGGGG